MFNVNETALHWLKLDIPNCDAALCTSLESCGRFRLFPCCSLLPLPLSLLMRALASVAVDVTRLQALIRTFSGTIVHFFGPRSAKGDESSPALFTLPLSSLMLRAVVSVAVDAKKQLPSGVDESLWWNCCSLFRATLYEDKSCHRRRFCSHPCSIVTDKRSCFCCS